jgi:hypothetical protein
MAKGVEDVSDFYSWARSQRPTDLVSAMREVADTGNTSGFERLARGFVKGESPREKN